jgi:hypothetical protein
MRVVDIQRGFVGCVPMSDANGGFAVGVMLSSNDDLPPRDRWARLRFAIIGPLLAAPPAPGDLQTALRDLAAKRWRHPFTGLEVRFGCSTLERWYYAAKNAGDPVGVLRNQVRRDIGPLSQHLQCRRAGAARTISTASVVDRATAC